MRAKSLIVISLLGSLAGTSTALAETKLTVMSFNIWSGGANAGKPVDDTVAAIRAAGADIVGVQEVRIESDPCEADHCPATGSSVAKALADALGFHVYDQTVTNDALWANAIHPLSDRSSHAE